MQITDLIGTVHKSMPNMVHGSSQMFNYSEHISSKLKY